MVVEDVEDFHAGAIGEVPVGDVGLPELVGLLGGEPFPGTAGAFVRLGCDEAAAGQAAPDGRYCRDFGEGGVAQQVGVDGVGAGVIALFGQAFAQPHDGVLDVVVDGVGVVVGASGARLEGRRALGGIAPA